MNISLWPITALTIQEFELVGFRERRVFWLAAAGCSSCVIYFYLRDRGGFPTTPLSPIFQYLLVVNDRPVAWISVLICGLAVAIRWVEPFTRTARFLGQHVIVVAFAAVLLGAAGALWIYRAYPLSMDEYAAVFQAKVFASGSLSGHMPSGYSHWLLVSGFNGEFFDASDKTGQIIETYLPGFALLLAPFALVHAAWLCNTLLAGVSIVLIHRITLALSGSKEASGWAVLFAIASSAFAATAISLYSMQAHLTLNLLFVALLLKPTPYRAFGAGLVGALAMNLHNPVPHLIFALPWLIAIAIDRSRWRLMLPLCLGYLPGVLLGACWIALRSDIAQSAVSLTAYNGNQQVFAWPSASTFDLRVANFVKLWLWAVPGLFVFAGLGVSRLRNNSGVLLLASSVVATLVLYFFVIFDQGHGWGYRYFQSAWGGIPILAGCAMAGPEPNRRLASFAGAAAVLSLMICVPFQLSQIHSFIDAHLSQLGAPLRPGNNVYFVHPRGGAYLADMVQFDPLLRDRDLVFVSRGAPLDAKLIRDNWPDATKIVTNRAYEQWYLGPADRRELDAGSETRRFVLKP